MILTHQILSKLRSDRVLPIRIVRRSSRCWDDGGEADSPAGPGADGVAAQLPDLRFGRDLSRIVRRVFRGTVGRVREGRIPRCVEALQK